LLHGGAIVVPLEGRQETAAVPGSRSDRQIEPGVGEQSRAHREALIWLVGANLDGRRAFHPVRSTDAPDNDEHGGT
jgi:hypothetical protein